MLLVIGSRTDRVATAVVARWRAAGLPAERLSCADLSRPGWQLTSSGAPPQGVLAGRRIDGARLSGVVMRLAGVTEDEITHVHPADRAYVAAEMHAFLLAWLSALVCPVLNRPTPGSLAGPAFAPAEWIACAADAGLAVRPSLQRASLAAPVADTLGAPAPDTSIVHVVGDTCIGGDDAAREPGDARALARAAGTELLRVVFRRDPGAGRSIFQGADPWVDLADPRVADAVRRRCLP